MPLHGVVDVPPPSISSQHAQQPPSLQYTPPASAHVCPMPIPTAAHFANACVVKQVHNAPHIIVIFIGFILFSPIPFICVLCQYKGSFKFGFFYVDVWPANVVKFKGLMIKCVPFENEPLFSAVVFYKK